MFANSTPASRPTIASDLPAFLVNPTGELEESDAVERRPRRAAAAASETRRRSASEQAGTPTRSLPGARHGADFVGNERWFNTADGKPLTLERAARQGRARRLLDLHLHQLHPHAALPEGLGREVPRRRASMIVGVHTPEFPFERDAGNVARRDRPERDRLSGRPGQRATRPGTPTATSTGRPST